MANAQHGDRAAWFQGGCAQCSGTGAAPLRAWRMLLLGAPGIGKGTQAEYISAYTGACHLSTGDVFRFAKNSGGCLTPSMQSALEFMKRGELVPDSVVIDMVRERVRCIACGHGFLLDGFPRTVEQAIALDALLTEAGVQLDAVLSFDLDEEKVIARLSGRRTCPTCKRTYHITGNPPKVAGICDHDGAALIQREDDRPEAIAVRLRAYHKQTAPLIDYYAAKGLLHSINADGNPEAVFGRAREVLGSLVPVG